MGREVGGGIGMGKTCEPKAFSFQCMTKFTTNKKIIIIKKIKTIFRIGLLNIIIFKGNLDAFQPHSNEQES